MRIHGWPYREMVAVLRSDCGVTISVSALHNYCRRRGIAKPKRRARDQAATPSDTPSSETNDADDWGFVVPKSLKTWKARGEDRPPPTPKP